MVGHLLLGHRHFVLGGLHVEPPLHAGQILPGLFILLLLLVLAGGRAPPPAHLEEQVGGDLLPLLHQSAHVQALDNGRNVRLQLVPSYKKLVEQISQRSGAHRKKTLVNKRKKVLEIGFKRNLDIIKVKGIKIVKYSRYKKI